MPPFGVGYFRACMGAEYIANKLTNRERYLWVTYGQFQFQTLLAFCFYTMVDEGK